MDAPDAGFGRREQDRLPGLLCVKKPEVQGVREPWHRCHRFRRRLYCESAAWIISEMALSTSCHCDIVTHRTALLTSCHKDVIKRTCITPW